MDGSAEWVFLVEVLSQCRGFRRDWSRVVQHTAAIQTAGNESARERIADLFDDAADLLQHAANISKILWPGQGAKKRALERGRHLRSSLGLTDDHVLANRQLRNHLEHYDERLDIWAESKHDIRNIVDGFVGSRSAIADVDDRDIMRLYDPAEQTYFFRGETYDLRSIEAGLDDVARRAEQRLTSTVPERFAQLRSARLI